MKKMSVFIRLIELVICIIAGTLLILAVYILPTASMKENVARSSSVFDYEGIYPQLANGYKYTQLDNYTDSIMLGAAIYGEGGSLLDEAMNNYHIDCDDLSPTLALTNYANNADFDYYAVSYARYWHGYLVPLKIFLLFFEYTDFRVFNFIMQSILICIIVSLFYKNNIQKNLLAFGSALIVLNPLTAALSLQYSSIYYIILLSSIYLLYIYYKRQHLEFSHFCTLLFFTGVITSYLDLLTYPLSSFGILMTLYIILNNRINSKKHYVNDFMKGLITWGCGYFGMWMGKWSVGSLLLQSNIFSDALNQAMFRTSSSVGVVENTSRMDAIIKNFGVLMKWPFVGMGIMICLYFIKDLTFKKNRISNIFINEISTIVAFLLISVLPIMWFLVFANHSQEHYWFTYKILSISCFSLLSLLIFIKEKYVNDKQYTIGE
ncbi:hypothetical protein [Kineothrix sedimenti]|uniref:Glycosyltransferase RgtA/B/C/D-like domain-containing protein n=1 Tax=Kineothrix sedimenti TaxID=3123317 RepID=A0ABZ3EXX5_9FIRM